MTIAGRKWLEEKIKNWPEQAPRANFAHAEFFLSCFCEEACMRAMEIHRQNLIHDLETCQGIAVNELRRTLGIP